MERVVEIFDTTLRDGLRNSGLRIALADKVRFARQLERLGVDVIEIGYGGPHEVAPMREIAAALADPVVLGISRVNRKDVDRVLSGVEPARRPGINVFSPTSEAFLARSGLSRQQALDAAAEAVAHARAHVDHVQFSAQDASRSDLRYLAEVFAAAASAGAKTLCIADTTGCATPDRFGALCRDVRAALPANADLRWSVHCHDDRGHAIANCLAAVEQGVQQVECTISGVGERAGNTPLEGVLKALGAAGSLRTHVSSERLSEAGDLLREISRRLEPEDPSDERSQPS